MRASPTMGVPEGRGRSGGVFKDDAAATRRSRGGIARKRVRGLGSNDTALSTDGGAGNAVLGPGGAAGAQGVWQGRPLHLHRGVATSRLLLERGEWRRSGSGARRSHARAPAISGCCFG